MEKARKVWIILSALLVLVTAVAILYFVPPESFWVALGLAIAMVGYYVLVLVIRGQSVREKTPKPWHSIFSLFSYFLILSIIFGVLFFYVVSSAMELVLMVAIVFVLVMNLITVPLAIIHKFKEGRTLNTDLKEYPSISVIVPAFNEEKVIARTLENLIEAHYPNKEIIVVDDGSSDSTYEVASRYVNRGVKVIHRENGGKFAALNVGLCYAQGEIVITVDADTLVARTALLEIVKSFTDPDIGGVAGNLKVFNRHKFLTKLQSLEYLTQLEIVRRAFDNFGTVTVAPGAFSAFRKVAVAEAGNYDPDRLLEDFDLTIKLQKAHRFLCGDSDALAYTEAPETFRDVYKQRLGWYRGDFQNFWKHRDVFINSKFGFMHSLTLPYMLISMTLVPLAGIVVIASSIMMLLAGDWQTVLFAFILFAFLQLAVSILAILIGKDDLKLCIYAPFYIVGYKQILDFIMIKALIDIILSGGQYLKRERVQRYGFDETEKHPAHESHEMEPSRK